MVHKRRTLVSFSVNGRREILSVADALSLAQELTTKARAISAETFSLGKDYLRREDIANALSDLPNQVVKHRVAVLYRSLHAYSLKVPSLEAVCIVCGGSVLDRCTGSIMNHKPGAHSIIAFNSNAVRSIDPHYFRLVTPKVGQRTIDDLATLVSTLSD